MLVALAAGATFEFWSFYKSTFCNCGIFPLFSSSCVINMLSRLPFHLQTTVGDVHPGLLLFSPQFAMSQASVFVGGYKKEHAWIIYAKQEYINWQTDTSNNMQAMAAVCIELIAYVVSAGTLSFVTSWRSAVWGFSLSISDWRYGCCGTQFMQIFAWVLIQFNLKVITNMKVSGTLSLSR